MLPHPSDGNGQIRDHNPNPLAHYRTGACNASLGRLRRNGQTEQSRSRHGRLAIPTAGACRGGPGVARQPSCANLDVNTVAERGTLGLALHPRFERTHYLYVYYTNRTPLENRVTRFKVIRNRCRWPRHIIRGIPSPSSIHQGGQLEFLNGKLFVSVGDGGNAAKAQSLDSRLGKIRRQQETSISRPSSRSSALSECAKSALCT